MINIFCSHRGLLIDRDHFSRVVLVGVGLCKEDKVVNSFNYSPAQQGCSQRLYHVEAHKKMENQEVSEPVTLLFR